MASSSAESIMTGHRSKAAYGCCQSESGWGWSSYLSLKSIMLLLLSGTLDLDPVELSSIHTVLDTVQFYSRLSSIWVDPKIDELPCL